MDPIAQLFLQLGIAGAILFVVYKLGGKMLDQQARSEAVRTQAIAVGFAAITSELRTHASDEAERDRHTHIEIAAFKGMVSGVMDAADRFTPVSGVPVVPPNYMPPTPTPPPGQRDARRNSPVHGTPTVGGGYHERPAKRGGSHGDGG